MIQKQNLWDIVKGCEKSSFIGEAQAHDHGFQPVYLF